MNRRELLPVEMLVRDDQRVADHTRRVSVAEHQKWREALAAQQAAQQAQPDPLDDELDDTLADPIFDRLPERRSSKATGRLFGILDQLDREGSKP